MRLSDKIAYINHDIDDAIRARMFVEEQLPAVYTDILGHSVRERLNTMIHDIILNSLGKPEIKMSPGMEEAMQGLRRWMFENVYKNDIPKAEEGKAQQMIASLYDYYLKHVERLPAGVSLPDGGAGREEEPGGMRLHRRDERYLCHRSV